MKIVKWSSADECLNAQWVENEGSQIWLRGELLQPSSPYYTKYEKCDLIDFEPRVEALIKKYEEFMAYAKATNFFYRKDY